MGIRNSSVFYVIVGKAFAENSKLVDYFLHKSILFQKIFFVKWVGLCLTRPPRGYAPGGVPRCNLYICCLWATHLLKRINLHLNKRYDVHV